MPWRPLNREQAWLLPPSVEELVADDHPARMVAAFVDQLSDEEWSELGVELEASAWAVPPTIRGRCSRSGSTASCPACAPRAAWSGPAASSCPTST